ncbi:MAG TPA: hypothetical protein VKZ97_10050 [Flavobacteriaceae bacterium]|nr:hypothetical protein [Flavobacteriaceae bacterium]
MMHKLKALIILGVLVFSFHVPCFGQSEILNDQEVIRINTLLKKHSRNADSINFYANEMLKYSKQNNLKFWEYSAYVALGNSERIKNNTKQSNNFYHTALSIAKTIQDEKAQHMVMNNIALNHKRLRRNDSAFYYFKKLNAYHTKQLEVLPASMAKQNIG